MTAKQFYDWQTAGGTNDVLLLVDVLERAVIPWCVIGGVAVNHWARQPMVTQDLDLVIASDAVDRAVDLLGQAGFRAERFPWSEDIEHVTLFRFADRASMSDYWSFRRTQNPKMRKREDACVGGGKGYGTWTHGRYFCYVSKTSGRALLRWTDKRTNTYGVLDSTGDQLVPLYRAWIEVRP